MEGTSEHSFGIFYRTRVRDVMRGDVVTCGQEMSVQHIALLMKERKLGSCVVVAGSRPVGIVTERDLVYKVVAGDDGQGLRASDIMSSPPITVSPDDHLYEAVYLMVKHRCRRLIVVDAQGNLAGFLSMRDLLRLQGYEAGIVNERIAKAPDVPALSRLRPEIDEFIHKLFLNNLDGRALAEILTEFNDAVVRRILQLNITRLRLAGEPPPTRAWAWVCFGSEGRKEQVLRGDQDNGIILPSSIAPSATAYFRRLAEGVNEDLAAYGFALCQGGVMAREDKYFGPLPDWQSRVHALIHSVEQGPRLRDLTIVLDLRHIEGEAGLTESLRDYMLAEIQRYPPALRALADDAAIKPVPLTFLGRLQYQKDSQGRRGINVKKFGMLPLVAGVKAMAVEREVRATSTAERIAALEEMGALEHQSAGQLLFAHQLFLKLKLESSLEKVLHNRQTGGHFFYPEEWTEWERQDLKRAFKAVSHLHDLLKAHFVL